MSVQDLDRQRLVDICRRDENLTQAQLALQSLVASYEAPLQRFLWTKLNRRLARQDIEDITQQVFIKTWEQAESFRGKGTVRSWLFGMAIRMALDLARKRERQGCLLEAHPFITSDPDTPESRLLKRFQKEELAHATDRLPMRDKEVLRLCYDLELSYEAIAQQLHIPMDTVKSRLHRAKQKLKRFLTE